MRGSQWTVGYLAPALALALASTVPAQEQPQPPPTGTARWGEAPAGQPTGSLSGLVVDLPGLPPGATVTVKDRATGASRSVRTDGGGRWGVTGLPLDRVYTVVIDASCFAPVERDYTVAADHKDVDVSLEREAPVLPTFVKGLGGETVRGAKVTFYPGTLELPDPPDGTFDLVFRPGTIVTDDGGMAREPVCVTDPGDEAGVLPRWEFGPHGLRLRVSAPDYFPSVTDLESIRWARDWEYVTAALRGPRKYRGIQRLVANVVFLKEIESVLDQRPGVWVGPSGGFDSAGDLDPKSITDKSTFILDGQPVDETSDTMDPGAYRVLFGNSSGAGSFGVEGGASFRLVGGGASKALVPAAGEAPASGFSGGSGITSFTAGVARSGEKLEYDKLDDASPGGRDTTWNGSGTLVRAGVAQSFRLGRGVLLRFGYEHERLLETEMTRSPGLQATGGRLIEDSGRLSRRSHVARASVGWSGRHLSPWAGVRMSWETIRLSGEAAAEFDIPQGLLEQRISFVNEFEANRVLADFGLDVRIPRTRLFLRAQGATDGSDVRFGVSVSQAWFRGR